MSSCYIHSLILAVHFLLVFLQSYLLGTWILSALFDILLVGAVEVLAGITLSTLPSGL